MIKKITCLLVFALLLTACSEMVTGKTRTKEKTNVTKDIRGKWLSDRAYVNEVFDVAVDIPKDWHLSKKLHKNMREGASEMLAGDDENMKGAYKSAMEKMYTAFVSYRYPPGTPGKSNPNVSMIIENVAHLPGVKSGEDYLLLMEENIKNSKMKFEFHGPPKRTSIGGTDFAVRSSTMKMGGMSISQTCYAKKRKANVMIITVSTLTDKDKKTVEELTKTIRTASVAK